MSSEVVSSEVRSATAARVGGRCFGGGVEFGLDAVVVGAPGGDELLDLLAVEVFGDGAVGQGGYFGVGGEAEADELVDGEGVEEAELVFGEKVGEAELLFEADKAFVVLEGVGAKEAGHGEEDDRHQDHPQVDDDVVGPGVHGHEDGEDHVEEQQRRDEEVKGWVEARVVLERLWLSHSCDDNAGWAAASAASCGSLEFMAKKRIGVHVGTSGGCFTAVQRAADAGANTFQIFSSSPRQWKAAAVKPEDAEKMREARARLDVHPVAIHASYLINLCSQTESVRENSVDAFRGEVERALAMGAEFLVLHPGSWKGLTREEGLRLAAQGIERAIGTLGGGLKWQDHHFRILIENTAGAEFSLGGSFDQVAELVRTLQACAPVGVCLDTCHTHVAGYDIVTTEGYEATMRQIGETVGFEAVKVWHCNDAKAPMGSKLDQIGRASCRERV